MPTPVPPALSDYGNKTANEAQADLLRRSQLEQLNTLESVTLSTSDAALLQAQQHAEREEFLLLVMAFALCWVTGLYTWRLIVLAKNQSTFW